MWRKKTYYQSVCLAFGLIQLFSIVHNIYKTFNTYPTLETCGVFLNMCKTFEKVWHQGLIFKLKPIGILDSLSSLILKVP